MLVEVKDTLHFLFLKLRNRLGLSLGAFLFLTVYSMRRILAIRNK